MACRRAGASVTSLPGFISPCGSNARLIARSAAMPRRRRQAFELAELHLADAVLGRDRAARRDDQVVDEAASPPRRVGAPARRHRPRRARGRGNGRCRRRDGRTPLACAPGKARLDTRRRAVYHEVAASRRPAPKCRAAIVGPSARSASEIESRSRQNASACASLAAIDGILRQAVGQRRPHAARSSSAGLRACRHGRRSPSTSTMPADAAVERRRACPGMCLSTRSSVEPGTISKLSIASRSPPPSARSSASAAAGDRDPQPAGRARRPPPAPAAASRR